MESQRKYFGRGCRGEPARRIQQGLADEGLLQGKVDGVYGPGTEHAVGAWQGRKGIPASGAVDEPTWTGLTRTPLPTPFERMLQVTATMEGHGFTLAVGNFDGAYLTWGVIGFTLRSGSLGKVLQGAERRQPGILAQAFGEAPARELQQLLGQGPVQQEQWAQHNSLGSRRYDLAEPWKSGFRRLGEAAAGQQAQLDVVRGTYFANALRIADRYRLRSELGLALAFDISVQNGSVREPAHAWFVEHGGDSAQDEPQRRLLLAQAVAEVAKKEYRNDVLSRKKTFATGTGTVHGLSFDLANWGLADVESVPEPAQSEGGTS